MNSEGSVHNPRIFGSAVVSPRGQVVIPASARKELGIVPGETLLVCGSPHGQGLILLKIKAVEQMLAMASERLSTFEKLVQDYKPAKTASGKGG